MINVMVQIVKKNTSQNRLIEKPKDTNAIKKTILNLIEQAKQN